MRLIAAGLAAIALAGGCTGEGTSGQPSPTVGSTDSSDAGERLSDLDIQIYSDAIERLVTEDNTFGGKGIPFDHIFVIDGPVPRVANGMTEFVRSGEPFDEASREAIAARLGHLPPLDFVADVDEATEHHLRFKDVKDNGVVISLGPIRRKSPEKAVVGFGMWCGGGLCGLWGTYRVKRLGDRWQITGTVGAPIIS